MRRRLVLVAGALLLAGCELPSFGAPDSASRQGDDVLTLWKGFFVAAMVVGAIVLGLIAYVTIRFRRRDDHIPSQKAANIPLEIAYTITPIVIVAVLFGFSVVAEQRITKTVDHPPLTVNVTGFQWGWQFEYPDKKVTVLGTGEAQPPELFLPVGETTRLTLTTNDVNHSFWVPHFLEKRDLIEGVDNTIDITPTEIGRYDGRCAEYCGLDHWRMDFIVNVVSQSDFDKWDRGAAMTIVAERPPASDAPEPADEPQARGLLAFLTSTDHKRIGVSYMVTAFVFFLIGGALAEVIRVQLYSPNSHVVSESTYNELFTMHGSIMLFLFLGPFAFGLANYFVPLQVGARDMAFPRLNALSYWFYLFGGLTMLAGFLTADGAAGFGWTAYAPLAEISRSPGYGADLWIMAVVLTGLSGVLTGVNIIATVLTMRAPGMTMFRMPIFTWNMLVTSVLVLIAFPMLTSAGAMLFADRHLGAHIFDPGGGGSPILWQHLFWFFGHPEVYILVLPYFGVITEVLPVFSRRPVFGYSGIVLATLAIASLSVGVWAHHMFSTGAVTLAYFSGLSMLIAVPTGVKFFNWIGTMWGGSITFPAAMKFAIGFMVTFLFGGLSGVMLAAAPIDFHVTDTYFVVAHMHYVLFGGSVFALYAGVFYWFPKVTGRRLNERLGTIQFWMTFVGFHLTFFVQHILGLDGMPRRVASYLSTDGFTTLNRISTIGAGLLGASTLPFLWNVWRTLRRRDDDSTVAGDDPWGGHTLEWATTSPPPVHNFKGPLPAIRSNRPVWDLHHPDAPQT